MIHIPLKLSNILSSFWQKKFCCRQVCNGQGKEICQTVYESSCSTKYVEKQPGKFVGDTSCEKLPVEICGAGCTLEEGEEECHDKVIASLVDVPEEVCRDIIYDGERSADMYIILSGVWSQPPEDLSLCDKVGAQSESWTPMHNCAQGDLYPQVHSAKAGQ